MLSVNFSRALSVAVLGAAVTVLAGCAAVKLPAPTASGSTVQQLRSTKLVPARSGSFVLAPGKDPGMDQKVGGLRGSSVTAESGSYAQYLKDTLVAELKAAGLYDEAAGVIIEGQLTDSQVDAAIGTGTARLAARFMVLRTGRQVFDKELVVDARWDSSFIGAVAIPAAINQYTALYKALVAKLFADEGFQAALAP